MTDIYEYAYTGDLDNIINLHKQGVNIRSYGSSLLLLAAKNGHINVVEYLVQHGIRPDKYALYAAIQNGYIDMVEYLIQLGLDPNLDDGEPYRLAMQSGYPDIAQMLIDYGADFE